MIMITHWLNTIIKLDQSLVISCGTVGEFDTLHALLTDHCYVLHGMFWSIVNALGETTVDCLGRQAAVKKNV